DAGMDDHLAKPVDPELLYGMLGRWLPTRIPDRGAVTRQDALVEGPPAPAMVPTPQSSAAVAPPNRATGSPAAADDGPDFSGIPGLTMTRALIYLPGRKQVYARVLKQFAGDYRHGLNGLDAAVAEGHHAQARQLLHSLRGACGAVGATEIVAEALALETTLQAADEQTAPSTEDLTGRARQLDQHL
ncbi:MAG: hypothetical protein CFE45_40335, partial [Burkholderiales bacterium PBB5]